jgi:hypothetical protein
VLIPQKLPTVVMEDSSRNLCSNEPLESKWCTRVFATVLRNSDVSNFWYGDTPDRSESRFPAVYSKSVLCKNEHESRALLPARRLSC